ncbi:hypothetical protein SPWS13_2431 [Shewanella putrefaciens]|nr:hypothetical protein SPWS13_2431 [Shewanella putrefaciens]
MDVLVEPSGMSLWRVTGETMAMNATQLSYLALGHLRS